MLRFTSIPVGLILCWAALIIPGLGYVRMVGYLAMASTAVVILGMRELKMPSWASKAGWTSVGIWISVSWWMVFTNRVGDFIPEGQHISRTGKVPTYDDSIADLVLKEFPNEPVFTTIETGSHALERWNFRKKVFIDGFFAPHPKTVWDAYHHALDSGNLERLYQEHGLSIAVIPTTSGPWVEAFLHSTEWNPFAIGAGAILFLHHSIPLQERHPQILMSADQLRATSGFYRYHALKDLFLIVASSEEHPSGFSSNEWTSNPRFEQLRALAKEVFPKRED
jgi:hypothetical protein